jgi:hypothetical protein
MLFKHLGAADMLNRTTILQRVGVSEVADRFMVGSRTDAIRGIPSARGIEITPLPRSKLSGQTSNFAIIPSAAAGEIQADNNKDSDLIEDPTPKPSTTPSSGRNNTKPKQPNPTPNRTHRSVLRPLPHAGYLHVRQKYFPYGKRSKYTTQSIR